MVVRVVNLLCALGYLCQISFLHPRAAGSIMPQKLAQKWRDELGARGVTNSRRLRVSRADDSATKRRKEDAKGRKKSSTEKMLPLTLQGTRKKYVFFAKQDPGRARQNS